MKRTVLLLLPLLLSVASLAHAQKTNQMNWKASIGVGVSASEAMNIGFAKGVQVTFAEGIYELGIAFHHATSQTLAMDKRFAQAFYNKTTAPTFNFSQGSNDKRTKHESANTSSINFFAGLNLLKIFNVESQHHVIVGLLGGIGMYDNSLIINKPGSNFVEVRYGAMWSYGARVAYEYMFNARVGAGISATYDVPQQNFYGLANLVVRF